MPFILLCSADQVCGDDPTLSCKVSDNASLISNLIYINNLDCC